MIRLSFDGFYSGPFPCVLNEFTEYCEILKTVSSLEKTSPHCMSVECCGERYGDIFSNKSLLLDKTEVKDDKCKNCGDYVIWK